MSDDRAKRMAGRFGGDDEDEPEADVEAEPEAPSGDEAEDEVQAPQEGPSEAPQEDESATDGSDERVKNITDHPTIQIYDVEGYRDEIDDLFRDLEYVHERALDQDFGKHTDFYPALLRAGLDQIYEELDIDENEVPRL